LESILSIKRTSRWQTTGFSIASLVGLAVHIAFILLSGKLSDFIADRVFEQAMRSATEGWDPPYIPGYETWEAGWVFALILMNTPLYVYLPTILLTMFATGIFPIQSQQTGCRQVVERGLQVGGILLGLSTIIYTLFVIYIAF
jgi:uncharacterized membrane protein (DUF485 family)